MAQYLTDQAATDHKAATLDSILAAIQHHHRVAGLSSPDDHPDVQAVRSGIRRELADFHAIRRQPGHRSPAIVDRYVRLAVGTSGLKLL